MPIPEEYFDSSRRKGRPKGKCLVPGCSNPIEVNVTVRIQEADGQKLGRSNTRSRRYCWEHGDIMFSDLSERLEHNEGIGNA